MTAIQQQNSALLTRTTTVQSWLPMALSLDKPLKVTALPNYSNYTKI